MWKSTNSSGASSRTILKLMKRSRIAETQCSGICNNTKMQFHQNTCLSLSKKLLCEWASTRAFSTGRKYDIDYTDIKAYESARLFVLRTMRRITRMDQNYHHISGTRMLNENRMATCGEKIRRRTFGFWKKIISKAPLLRLSPERMLMGMPYILWDDQAFQQEGRARNYAKTMTRYLTERALQLYYYTEILGKLVDFDHKALIKQLLRFEDVSRKLDANHKS